MHAEFAARVAITAAVAETAEVVATVVLVVVVVVPGRILQVPVDGSSSPVAIELISRARYDGSGGSGGGWSWSSVVSAIVCCRNKVSVKGVWVRFSRT